MCVITYTAVDRGLLMPGTSEGDLVVMELPLGLEKWTPFTVRKGNEIKAISGKAFSTFLREDRGFYATTNIVKDASLNIQMYEEFASSVAGGETFDIDPYGLLDSPDETLQVKLQKGSTVSASRHKYTAWFTYAFTVEVVI